MDVEERRCKEAAGALIYASSTKRYLFLLRDGSKYSGTWGIAGGKVDPGERITEALFREIEEETSTDLSKYKPIPIETFTSHDQKFIYYTFMLDVVDEFIPKLNSEHRGYCWVELKDYPKPLHPGVWRTFKFSVIIDKLETLQRILI
jgi:8-oxo-dGTP pyrophosphatase MutT (NUDIX family)